MSKVSDRLQARVTRLYIDMRLKRISKLNWLSETEETLIALRQLEQSDIAGELFYIQLLITKEAYEAAEELLEKAAEWLRQHSQEAPACHAYYLYLTTLLREDQDYDMKVTAKLTELSRKHPDIWQIDWLLYYVDHSLAGQPLEQYHFVKRMFLKGCRSPLMYLEARVLLERNPTFLYEFSEFEVQLMIFMIRYAGMSERVSTILAEYMLQRTDYRYLYFIILCGCYEITPSRRVLEGICRMMVLGGCQGEKFMPWYKKGIADKIQVTGLYEAFMRSLPIEKWYLDGEELSEHRRIPSEVIQYFAHASGLDTVGTAYLYAIVHKYRENWMSSYRLYEPLMEPFMMDQLYKGNVNPGLAYLYKQLLVTARIPAECRERFLNICYTEHISQLPMEAGTLIIRYDHLDKEVRVPFSGREAKVPVFGKQYALWAESYSGNVLAVTEAVIWPFMEQNRWRAYFKEQGTDNLFFHLAETEIAMETEELKTVLDSVKQVLYAEPVLLSFKEMVAEQVFPYWDVNGAYEEILEAVPFVFTENGTYSKEKESAFWRRQYLQGRIGIYGVQFLMDHYEGTLLERGSIFTRARGLGIDTAAYAEKLLQDMMSAEQVLPQHLEILESYCQGQPDKELLRDYLEFEAVYAYLSEKLPEGLLLQRQAELTAEGYSFSVIAQLAFLQKLTHTGVGSMGQELTEAAEGYVKNLLAQNIYFHWMQPLTCICPELESREAFQVLEYRGHFDGPVWVRFYLHREGKEDAEALQSEVMEAVCRGIYAKNFLLFFGERIHYEIFGLQGADQKLLKQGVLQRGRSFAEQGGNRFIRLNRMLALREKRENLELYQELEAYYGQSAVVEQLFHLK